MKQKLINLKNSIIPRNVTTYLILGLIILGVIAGSIFFISISKTDKLEATNEIMNFYQNIKNINYGQTLKNSFNTSIFYLCGISILSLTIIGLPFLIFLIFFKGFILGFCISTIINTYHYKGILYSFLYLFPHELIKLFSIILTSIYGIILSIKLLKLIFTKKNINYKLSLKRYSIIMIISMFLNGLAILYETYIYPIVLKIII
ncbi:MAG: stage II sporulation protein M [Tenericutes bacterium]|nr:stage II sporulation protein M [Mycoplasmatota bacterium]